MTTHVPALRRPRVLLVSPPVTPPWLNGTVLLARDLATGGRRFHYHVLGTAGQRALDGLAVVEPVYPRGSSGGGLRSRLRVLWRLVRRDECHVHHFFFSPHRAASTVIKTALRLSRKPSIHTVPSQPSGGDLERLMFADRVVCVSEATAILLQTAGIEDIRVIRPAVVTPDEPADRAASRERLRRLGIGHGWGDAPVFLYAGDLEFSDGARIFAAAVAEAADAIPDARFAFACRPKTEASDRVMTSVKAQLRRAGLAPRVEWIGVCPDMPALLGAVDAVVMPVDSLYAKVDFPYVLLEAMALGTPVVVSNLAPLSELAALGRGAIAVPKSSPGAAAAAMDALARDPEDAARRGKAARATIARYFQPEAMVSAYEDLYLEVLGG